MDVYLNARLWPVSSTLIKYRKDQRPFYYDGRHQENLSQHLSQQCRTIIELPAFGKVWSTSHLLRVSREDVEVSLKLEMS